MPFGEIVCGSPGSGKSTYCYGKYQLLTALNRPISVVNLDPANEHIPYPCAIDISALITLRDVMDEHGLGPNGGMLYCMEYLEENYDWLEERVKELGPDAYILFDLPGQVELSTNHDSVKRIIQKLTKSGVRVSPFTVCDFPPTSLCAARRRPSLRRALRHGRREIHIRTSALPAHDAAPRAASHQRPLESGSDLSIWGSRLQPRFLHRSTRSILPGERAVGRLAPLRSVEHGDHVADRGLRTRGLRDARSRGQSIDAEPVPRHRSRDWVRLRAAGGVQGPARRGGGGRRPAGDAPECVRAVLERGWGD